MTLDLDLKHEDIQSLSNRDSVVSLFTALNYNTEARVRQSAANLGIGTESVVREIKHIEQIASQDGLLHVYLFELTSVTVTLTNALARAFRNKQGEYLLVLTSDYERLDFVLVERAIPMSEAGTGIGEKQVTLRPRVLTIERRKPTRRQLRVLRRFSYTESDPYFQFEKLKSAYSIYDWSEEHFNNRILFADYYLQERLRDQPEWREDVKPLYLKVQEIMLEAAHIWQGKRESELRTGLYEKLFAVLGFTHRREKGSRDDSPTPDYALFGKSGENPIAVCLCYPWGRSLDSKDDQRDLDTPEENPSAAVVSILKDGKAPWAIVTNGKLWRLYNARTSSVAASFYEIDLKEILAAPTQLASPSTFDLSDSFKYFSLFFRREAFEPRTEVIAGEERKATFLDSLLRGSEEYAKRLGERLKDRVFEDVFIHFAEGFIEFIKRRDGEDADLSQEKLDEVFQGTLTLLYRLLFMLYAESRDLFPVKEIRGYYEKSLTRLKQEVAEAGGTIAAVAVQSLKEKYTVSSTALYDRMLELFRIVDQGDPSINVPMYNGGLFLSDPSADDQSEDSRLARFLLQTSVPDRYLAAGLDLLARDEDDKTFKLVFIDYKSLGVRQLGSIYEGLLEFKLRIAREKMAVVKGKKTEEVMPYDEAVKKGLRVLSERRNGSKTERLIAKGRLYLENDKRERKATGSYYTPDHIVKYIVENTVGPVLKEKLEKLAPEFRKAQQAYREALNRRDAFIAKKMKPDDPEKVANSYAKVVALLFDVKVLDPAMGSGHFLVEAADFISDRLIDFLNGFPWNPVLKTLNDTRQTILAEMERQGVVIDGARLTDVNLIKRHVLKRCVYGVDLNPMAVELAKVSLWLNCFTLGAPLSFLDHHLKCGNSLIGADIDELRVELEKDLFGTQLAGLMQATQQMIHVGELSDVTPDMIHESKQSFQNASVVLQPFKEVLDLWISQYFGNEIVLNLFKSGDFPQIGSQWKRALLQKKTASVKKDGEERKIPVADLLITAATQAVEQRFFHWELEFPEVFYEKGTKKENGGFDSVVGNPPWIMVKAIDDRSKAFYSAKYKCATGKYDIYSVFTEVGIDTVRRSGRVGVIISNKFLRAAYGDTLKAFLARETHIDRIIDYSDLPLFEGAVNYPLVLLLVKEPHVRGKFVDIIVFKDGLRQVPEAELAEVMREPFRRRYSVSLRVNQTELLDKNAWTFQAGGLKSHSFDSISSNLRDLSLTICQGVWTGKKDVFVDGVTHQMVMKGNIEAQIVSPVVDGEDVDRYSLEQLVPKYIVYPYKLIENSLTLVDIEKFPKAKRYLQPHKSELEKRLSWGETIVSAGKKWYEIWNPSPDLQKPKILTQDIADRNRFALDKNGGVLAMNTCYAIILSNQVRISASFILALLNSALLTALFSRISPKLQGGFYRYKKQYLEQLPIRRVHFTTSEKERSELVAKSKRLYEDYLAKGDPLHLTGLVDQLLPRDEAGNFLAFKEAATGAEEKSDVIHDLLAFLAEEMTHLNKQKQGEMKRFLGWLEKELRIVQSKEGSIGLQALSGRTRLLNYLGDYQRQESPLSYDELEDILFKNKSRIGVSVNNPAFTSKLRIEFERSLDALHPIRSKLERTDSLIDRIVYLLYGLSPEEIEIVEGKSRHTEEGKTAVTLKSTESASFSVARDSDPRLFAEVLKEIQLAGATTSRQLSNAITPRIKPLGLSFEADKADKVEYELEKLGWIRRGQNQISLTETGQEILRNKGSLDPFGLARRIATANERQNAQVVSRLLARLWELNPEQQGAVPIPQLGKDELPKRLPDFRYYLLNISPKWIAGLAKTVSGFRPQFEPEALVSRVIDGLKKNWDSQTPSNRLSRSQELIAEYFLDVMFSGIVTPSDVEIWQRRLEWAGLTFLGREIPNVSGYVWFPVGAFREIAAPGFAPEPEIKQGNSAFHVHELAPEEEPIFAETLFEAYMQRQQIEHVEYVSLMAVRDLVCYRLRIGAESFQRMLQNLFPKAVRGEVTYGMALEVDITPLERRRYRYTIPIIIDGTPRYIISMRKRQLREE